jgi:sarcosine oxidase
MMGSMDLAVVGVGGTGSAAMFHAARRGHRVVGFERFALGHDRGSSHGASRIIRYTYPDPLYTEWMHAAYPLWDELSELSGTDLFVRTGGLYLGAQGDANIERTMAALAAQGVPFEHLSAPAANERFAALHLRADEHAVFQSSSGFLRAGQVVFANVSLAKAHGAELREHCVVASMHPRGPKTVLCLDTGEEHAFDAVLVTAGPYVKELLPTLPVRVTRQQIVYLAAPRDPMPFGVGNMPVWIDTTANNYGFPLDPKAPGLKLASHDLGNEVAPAASARQVDDAYLAAMQRYASERMPRAASSVVHAETCLYTNAPDEDFIVDRFPGHENAWIVSGCSGHGFKFTTLLGLVGTRLAAGHAPGVPVERFRLERFA